MKNSIREYLFSKHILVATKRGENQVETLYGLLTQCNVKVVDGFKYANPDMIAYTADRLGAYVPEPFYRGFPQSVRNLTTEQRLFDQLVHYTRTYGFGDFEHVGHSLFEDGMKRRPLTEQCEPHEFRILREEDAVAEFKKFCVTMAQSSRPLNEEMLQLLVDAYNEYGWVPENVASKSNACTLLYATRNMHFCKFLSVLDVPRIVDTINWMGHGREHINRLNLTNQERKLVTKVLDYFLVENKPTPDEADRVIEKRQVWKGILHHVHYNTDNSRFPLRSQIFVFAIYNEETKSFWSRFQQLVVAGYQLEAAKALKSSRGNGELLRHLNYLVCDAGAKKTAEIVSLVDAKNPLILMQLQHSYRNYNRGPRTFRFTKHGRIRTHREDERSMTLSAARVSQMAELLEDRLAESLKGRVGKVYIAPGMERIGVPVNMSASESGFGVMPTGSRIKLPEGKKIRAFTYWEKVDDIDLSCFGIMTDGSRKEFSWRTMYNQQNDAVTYSGDETSGYNGGSEYFDIDFDKVAELYPDMKYIVFCDNVYSRKQFNDVVCRAGWMSRDVLDSGEVFEPKTVQSSFVIDAKSTFAYLFAIDIEKREVIWLNVIENSNSHVAGANQFDWLYDCFNLTETMNMYKLFKYMGEEVDTPEEADLVVGDIETDKEQIRSWEFEKVYEFLH